MNDESRRPRPTSTLIVFTAAFAFAFGGFLFLGVWQLQRLQWKLDLIERVESRIHAAPSAPPSVDEWPQVSVARDEYKHVRLEGHYLTGRDTRVQALTALGAGFWVLTPFQQRDGGIVLVNRGYVRPDWTGDTPPPATEVIGLLRLPETGGGFLRQNDPTVDRWHSRDVAAIATARGLDRVAPFFVDEEFVDEEFVDRGADTDPNARPRGGLTVIHFANNHLGYALTWFALALLVAWAGWRVARDERQLRRPQRPS